MPITAPDIESLDWPRAPASSGCDAAYARLHPLLLRFARRELARRPWIRGPELDDLAHQAAADALVAIRRRLPAFRGESRFLTWAYKFVLFEVARKAGRHFWRTPHTPLDAEDWERLPDRFGLDRARESEWPELIEALHRAVDEEAPRPARGRRAPGRTMNALESFLTVDPGDAGCELTLQLLHVYVEDVLAGRAPDPAILVHVSACPPCAEDFDALLHVR